MTAGRRRRPGESDPRLRAGEEQQRAGVERRAHAQERRQQTNTTRGAGRYEREFELRILVVVIDQLAAIVTMGGSVATRCVGGIVVVLAGIRARNGVMVRTVRIGVLGVVMCTMGMALDSRMPDGKRGH